MSLLDLSGRIRARSTQKLLSTSDESIIRQIVLQNEGATVKTSPLVYRLSRSIHQKNSTVIFSDDALMNMVSIACLDIG